VLHGVADGSRYCWGTTVGQPTWVSPYGARSGHEGASLCERDVSAGAAAGCGTRDVGQDVDGSSGDRQRIQTGIY
jgi:hypothetical protein